jgi:hypothetical protein
MSFIQKIKRFIKENPKKECDILICTNTHSTIEDEKIEYLFPAKRLIDFIKKSGR